MSLNMNEYIRILRKQAVKAEMLVPAGVNGHNPNYRSSIGYNPVLANKLLDHFICYKRRQMVIARSQMASL